jgi:hypothetical protein
MSVEEQWGCVLRAKQSTLLGRFNLIKCDTSSPQHPITAPPPPSPKVAPIGSSCNSFHLTGPLSCHNVGHLGPTGTHYSVAGRQ